MQVLLDFTLFLVLLLFCLLLALWSTDLDVLADIWYELGKVAA